MFCDFKKKLWFTTWFLVVPALLYVLCHFLHLVMSYHMMVIFWFAVELFLHCCSYFCWYMLCSDVMILHFIRCHLKCVPIG